MLWIHPLLQLATTALALYVLFLGWARFQANHLGRRTTFLQAEHARLGKYAHILWMAGLVLGQYAAAQHFGANNVTGHHYWIGQILMPCIAGGYITGVTMDRDPKKRAYMPLIHALCNVLAVLLALAQAATGVRILRDLLF